MIDKDSINQVGCIHTSQGLELDYAGVIIGNDLRFEDGKIITGFTKRAKSDQSIKGLKKLMASDSKKAKKIADEIILNTYRVLMTRGQKGCYVYCEDDKLAIYLKNRIEKIKAIEKEFLRD